MDEFDAHAKGGAAREAWPLWRSVLIVGILAGLIDAGQYLVFPCTLSGWFPPAVGFVFFLCCLLFVVLVGRRGLRLLSLIPLAIAAVTALPWLISHMCP